MKVYVLHDCYEKTDYYAEANIVSVSRDEKKLQEIMKSAYEKSRNSHSGNLNDDETFLFDKFASVTEECEGYYFKHWWAIEGYEV